MLLPVYLLPFEQPCNPSYIKANAADDWGFGGIAPKESGFEMNDEHRPLVERIFENANFVRSLGIELISFGQSWCETRITAQPAHLQQHGFIHAGIIMTLADHTCGGAAASTVPEGKDVITVETKTSFLRPASGMELNCRAQVLRAGKNLIFVEAEVHNPRSGVPILVAKMSSTLAVIPLKSS